MKMFFACVIIGVYSCLQAQDVIADVIPDVGRSDPPFVEATATMPMKFINDKEKRCDMVSVLAAKSEMNYRLLAMKIDEKWQKSIKSEKNFLRNLRQYKTISFSVHKDGSITIRGVEDSKINKSSGKKAPSTDSSASPKASSDN